MAWVKTVISILSQSFWCSLVLWTVVVRNLLSVLYQWCHCTERTDLQDGCDVAMLDGKLGFSKLSGTLRKSETSRRVRAKHKKINFCRFKKIAFKYICIKCTITQVPLFERWVVIAKSIHWWPQEYGHCC